MHRIPPRLPYLYPLLRTSLTLAAQRSSCAHLATSSNLPPVQHIFNRSVKKRQRDRAALRKESRDVDYLKDEVADRLVDRLLDIKRRFSKVIDLGSGAGHIIKFVDSDMMDKLIMYDMSEKLLYRDKDIEYEVPTERIAGDEESLPFEENSVDAIMSSLSMHWVNDIPGTLIQAQRALKPDGVFIGAMFGGDTLYELRTSLQLAEIDREGGVSPHISPMTDVRDVANLLQRAGFNLITVDVDEIAVNYPSMFELMDDLRAMGESNAIAARKPYISRDTLMAAAATYKEIYGNDDGSVPATFQVIYMIGWKPDPSQPKPLARGSGEVSFKELEQGLTAGKLKEDQDGIVIGPPPSPPSGKK
ncbi:uncharacterized protein SPPG_00935 [Spizellomyces punctatus DAOM BR117]|uniref:Uncharacterized protein n=1 Tax=Spizellomyces punctatus (strain DAOM BR117) TaxID=645134 RepID=A0A0L0HQT3_SPIPD|nr:uncharacterized protein SPPG_00935 [Spizellomyces punctatus DAOM BR117]KND03452.1 hypothetical protein SPPG_00935 [Spizellomyces punctatus DAOM BR117]|eukprot:XP_016611491.1 hypothetical protein SPPG_00935 [Spizellomyces punctatus DAOM BR117]